MAALEIPKRSQNQSEEEQWEQIELRQQIEQQERYDDAYYIYYLVQAQWEQIVTLTKAFYPKALTTPCLVPALHFNRIPLAATTFQGLTVYVLTPDGKGLPPSKDKQRAKSQKTAQKKSNSKSTKSSEARDKARTSDQSRKSRDTLKVVSTGSTSPGKTTKSDDIPHKTTDVSHQRSSDVSPDTPQPSVISAQEDCCIPQLLWSRDDFKPGTAKLGKVPEAHLQADAAQGRLLHNLKQLGDRQREGMVIVSELDYDDYLCDKEQRFPHAVDSVPQLKNRVVDASKGDVNKGDIDVLIISPSRELLVGEVKSFIGNTDSEQSFKNGLSKVVREACKQLDKSGDVVRYWLSDIAPDVTVRKTLVLPNVSRESLKRVLEGSHHLHQSLKKSLGGEDTDDVTQLCLCCDDLSGNSQDDVREDRMTSLCSWWERRMPRSDVTGLPDDLYWQVAARFVGPASTVGVHCSTGPRVEVKTEGQALAELGRRLAKLVLTTQQLQLLHQNKPLVCITGGPGTGKTLMLVLQGLRWLRQGLDVYVFSWNVDTLPASCMIEHQLNMTMKAKSGLQTSPPAGRVHLYQADFVDGGAGEVSRVVSDLTRAADAHGGTLCFLLDEAHFGKHDWGHCLHSLVKQLSQRVQHLHFWLVATSNIDLPSQLHHETLTVPLRYTPVVLRHVKPALEKTSLSYDIIGFPAAGDGPDVIRLYHHGNGHTVQWPLDCEACGHKVADKLLYLGVGHEDCSPLHYRDVFVITSRQLGFHDDNGPASPATAIVRGLRAKGLPVCVISEEEHRTRPEVFVRNIQDVARAETDWVTVASSYILSSLERRVVVFLQDGRGLGDGEELNEDVRDGFDRFSALSRCTTQLILVEVPGHNSKIKTNARSSKNTTTTPAKNNNDDCDNQLSTTAKKTNSGVSWARKGFLNAQSRPDQTSSQIKQGQVSRSTEADDRDQNRHAQNLRSSEESNKSQNNDTHSLRSKGADKNQNKVKLKQRSRSNEADDKAVTKKDKKDDSTAVSWARKGFLL